MLSLEGLGKEIPAAPDVATERARVCMDVCMCVSVYVCMCVYVYVCMYVYVGACVYACVYV